MYSLMLLKYKHTSITIALGNTSQVKLIYCLIKNYSYLKLF